MARKEEPCKIEIKGEWTAERFASFQMLYYPLIGQDAAVLYHTLLAIGMRPQKIKNHILIQKISSLSMEAIEKSRLVLEQYLLVKTFYNGNKNTYLYQLYMPKDGNDFLRHEVFGRLYMKKMGKQVYEFNKLSFAHPMEDKTHYQDITIPFVNILKDEWKDQEEEQFKSLKPKQEANLHNDIPLSFNYDRFLEGLSKTVFPETARSEKNLRIIGELATIHGIDELQMRKLVSKSMNLKTNELNVEGLKKRARDAKTDYQILSQKNPYAIPPVRFLQAKQHGVEVSRSDKYLIESLISDYHMNPEVVNVLIEYVLHTKNMQFPKAYVEKVASTWVRLEIDTCEKAIEQIKNEQEQTAYKTTTKRKELPKWYHDQSDVATGVEEFDENELKENLKRLRGE